MHLMMKWLQRSSQPFNQAYASDDCKVIVLKAAGEVFSAGADLAYLKTAAKEFI